jgi:gliding motility-associated-like protein
MRKLLSSILLIGLIGFFNSTYSQDDCATAVDVPIDVYGTCGDMAFTNVNLDGAVPSADAPAPTCGSFGAATNDMWYTFTVPTGITEMAFHAFDAPSAMMAMPPLLPGAPACGPGMAVYRGDCGSLTLLDCFDAPDSFLQNNEIRWEVITGLVPGETIHVRLWEEDNDVTSFFFAASVLTSLPESDCASPPALSSAGCNILAPAGTIQAPDDCGWSSTDNVVFYSFEVLATDPQPVTINIEFGECWANDVDGLIPSEPTIQFAVYSWDGASCTGIGGSPLSDPPNNTTYYECREGTGTVVYSEDLPPGLYVLAMDGFSYEAGTSLCTFGIAASFIDPDPGTFDVTLATVDNGCGQVGSATVTVNSSCGGNPTVEWSSSVNTGLTENGLIAGNYTVTVTDDDPTCGDTVINFIIADNSSFVVSVTPSGNACAGPVTLTAQVMGADLADVTFLWDDTAGSTSQSISASDGTYTCVATYGTCIDSDDYTVVSGDFEFDVVYTPTVCAGSTGSALFNAIIGSGDYMYEWSTGQITAGITLPGAGDYCLTATDNISACQDVFCFTVIEVPAVNVTMDYDDISCKNAVDGWATAVVTGGTEPYDYSWSTFIETESIYDLISGNYAVTVEDVNGCTGTANVFIVEPPQFYYSVTPNQGICFGEQADIDVTVTGGTEPYLFDWSDSPGMDTDSRLVSPTVTTTYIVTVVDDNNCTYTSQNSTVTVSQPIVIDVTIVDVLCHGECTGSATLDVTGGIQPFDYSWESTSDYMQNICAGEYSLTITDMYDCVGDTDFEITESDTIYLTTNSGPATCFGYSDGYVEVDVIGGVPFANEFGEFYNYQWNSGSTEDSLAIYAGVHTVTVTDANGCSHVASAFVDQPEAVYVTNAWGGTICIGESFTTLVNATGGLGPYDFVWTGTDESNWYGNSMTVEPIETTSYQLIVTDDRGCFGPIQNITVNVNPVINIVNTNNSPAEICIGETTNVEMEIQGGNGGPYTIDFINNQIVNMPYTFYPPESGYYYFEVSDECGSPTDKDSIYVTVHPLPQVGFYADHTESCPPGIFYFTETTPDEGQTYLWDFGDGGYSVQKNPVHTYSETGVYDVALTAWSEFGCKRVRDYDNMIRVFPKPRAEFSGMPELVSIFNPMVEFTNYTEGGQTYFWNFGDGSTTLWTSMPQVHFYNALGEFEIMMIAKNQYECYDTAFKKIRVYDEFTFYAPDAFTPNGDGLNDEFYVIGHGIDKTQFYLVIYDRFGIKVFETDVFDEENTYRMAWDGSHNGSVVKGDPVISNGIYRWYCSFSDLNGKPREESGTVILIK